MHFLLEPSVRNQELVDSFLRRSDEGIHKMEGPIASLLTATHHTSVFYAHSLTKEDHYTSGAAGMHILYKSGKYKYYLAYGEGAVTLSSLHKSNRTIH